MIIRLSRADAAISSNPSFFSPYTRIFTGYYPLFSRSPAAPANLKGLLSPTTTPQHNSRNRKPTAKSKKSKK
jgi:hypothetical protein